jgi:hypothetical protein
MKKIIIVLLLVFCVLFAQEVKVNQSKLTIDGLLWGVYRYTKDSITTSTFGRRNAFIGLTGNITNWASARFYFDVANITGQPAYDLYALIKPIPILPNFQITVGQFKLPLGTEVLTKPENLELIEYSLIGRDPKRTPKGTRDIGFQVAYKHPLLEGTIAIVNGEGRNVLQDADNNKNIAGRLIIKPTKKTSLFCGVNAYLGKNFHRLGTEVNYTVSPIILKAEFLITKDGTIKDNGYYVQAGYNWHWLQPIIRYSAYSDLNEYVIGLNIRPMNDNIKLMLNYKSEKISPSLKQNGFLGQLQIAF